MKIGKQQLVLSGGQAPNAFSTRLCVAAFAYAIASVMQIAALVLVVKIAAPPTTLIVFQFLFFAQLLGGIEPGTAKAMLLRRDTAQRLSFPFVAVVQIPLLKAAIATPIVAMFWAAIAPDAIPVWQILAWTLLLAIVGFLTTELRTVFDAQGSYSFGIWLKQGGLAAGAVGLVCTIAAGGTWAWASAIYIGLRLIWIYGFYCKARSAIRQPLANEHILGDHWRDPRWIEIASVSLIAAASGSIDRIFAFQFLTPKDVSLYVLVYEIFSKLWLLPYVIAPMIFAEFAAARDGRRLLRIGVTMVTIMGVTALLVTALALGWADTLINNFLGVAPQFWPTLAFVLAVATAALTQLLLAALQGVGQTRVATIALVAGLMLTIPTFWLSTKFFGLSGLFFAWLLKSIFEISLVWLLFYRVSYRGI